MCTDTCKVSLEHAPGAKPLLCIGLYEQLGRAYKDRRSDLRVLGSAGYAGKCNMMYLMDWFYFTLNFRYIPGAIQSKVNDTPFVLVIRDICNQSGRSSSCSVLVLRILQRLQKR